MLRTSIAIVSLCALAGGAQAGEIEGALTTDALEGRYTMDTGVLGLEGNDLSAGLLVSDDRDVMGTVGLMVPGVVKKEPATPISLSVGARAYAALLDDPDDEVLGLAPGAEARFRLPMGMPMWFLANVFFAPDITTAGDADDVLDFNVRYEIRFLERTTAFVGYRLLEFDRGGDDDIVNSVQAGLRFAF